MSRIRKTLLIGFGALTMLLVGSGAHAVLTGGAGSYSDHQRFVNETNAWQTGAGAYVDVPGAATWINIPNGQYRMLDARFTAESYCAGGGWCSVRIVVQRPNGTWFELNPASSTDFAFDSGSGGDYWESNAIERTSSYLPGGNYRVKVQAGTVAGADSLRLDDWTLAVERVRP